MDVWTITHEDPDKAGEYHIKRGDQYKVPQPDAFENTGF